MSIRELLDALFVPAPRTVSGLIDLLCGAGGLAIHAASAGQVVATGAAQKFTLWETALPAGGGISAQVENNRIVVGTAGIYLVGWHMGYEVSGSASWTGHIYLDSADAGIDWARNVLAAARPGSISCAGILVIEAGGIIEAYIGHDGGGDVTCTPSASQLYAVRVG